LIKRYRQEIQEWKEIVEYYEQEHVQHQQQRQEIILNSTDVMDYVEKEHLEFLKLAKETTKKVDDLIEKVNENTPYQRYLVQHKLHSSQCVYEELHRDTELLYSKMLKASAERDRKEFVDPATVLSLISKS
jgi:dTDP-4-amino-4,6-dideoxygalactose transaminase